MAVCPRCGNEVELRFRFCPWCAEPQRRKLVEFFRAHPSGSGRALRVSRYYGGDPQVRFSVWDETGVARAAVSLAEPEAERLAGFLLAARASKPRRLLEHLRSREPGMRHRRRPLQRS
ncbi:MAG: hypothetical protein ABR569_01655 [Gaiellaceae bacterium]